MSRTLKLRQALEIDDKVLTGDPNNDQSVSLTNGNVYSVLDATVADDYGTATLWTTGDGGFTTYTHGYIYSDQDVVVELRTDNATPEYVVLFVRANELTPLPAKAGGNTTESADGSVLVDGTDYDDVDRLEVQRDAADGEGDATVSLFLFS